MVNKKKVVFIGSGILIMGSLSWAASTMPQSVNAAPRVKTTAAGAMAHSSVLPVAPHAGAQQGELALVPPPGELPVANSRAMVTSIKPVAPAAPAMAAAAAKPKKAAPAAGKAASGVKTAAAMAPARKAGKLFSYVRLLNYSPHPLEEEFLKDKPLVLNGHRYWLKVSYKESWDVVDDETGSLKKIAFNIKLMEGDKIVRDLQVPETKLDLKRVKRGQILGIAEVAPFKFNIAVDTFKVSGGGLSELVFKFDLTG